MSKFKRKASVPDKRNGVVRELPTQLPEIPDELERRAPGMKKWREEAQRTHEDLVEALSWQPSGTGEAGTGSDGKDGKKGKDGAPGTTTIITTQVLSPPAIEILPLGLQRQVWVSTRTDGKAGLGTASDPFNGSTAARFDALMLAIPTYSEVVLLPGTYETRGYDLSDQVNSWKVKAGWHLHGCGIERTTLKMVRGNDAAGYYAVVYGSNTGDALDAVRYGYGDGVTFHPPWVIVSDLTIDCNGQAFSTHPTIHGCHLAGNHARISRVRACNLTGGDTSELFVLLVVGNEFYGGLPLNADIVIEDCVVERPYWIGDAGCVAINSHGGGATQERVINGIIRNNVVDGQFTDGFISYIPSTPVGYPSGKQWGNAVGFPQGINMVIDGNHFRNCGGGGPYQDTWDMSGSDCVIKNNRYYNVQSGPYFNFGPTNRYKRVIVEDNDFTLKSTLGLTPASDMAHGITFVNNEDVNDPTILFKELVIRRNHFRFVGESMDTGQLSRAIQIMSADVAIIEDNLIRLPNAAAGTPQNNIWTKYITRLQCRNNRNPEDNSIVLPYDVAAAKFLGDMEYEQHKTAALGLMGW
jgi:hypothetical protein